MKALLLALALACSAPSQPAAVDGHEPSVRVFLDGRTTKVGGTIVVVVDAPAGGDLELPEPKVEGLAFREKGKARVERIGERVVVTRRFTFSGSAGHYEVPRLTARWGDGEAGSQPLWIDLDVDPPREGELADIEDPDPVRVLPWRLLAAAGGLGLLVMGGLWVAFGRDRKTLALAAPADPPDVVALGEWDRVRRDASLSDYDRALALSRIFREYTERVLSFPATAFTTTETVERLRALTHLPEGNVPRARRLLRATDRVKYADARAAAELFEELDADLRAFVGSTRPFSTRPA